MASEGPTRRPFLVLCLLNGWCFAARIFPSRRGASDEHIPQWICKERATKPGAKRTVALRVAPSLACGFVARRSQPHCGGCSLLAPRHRPNWAQQNTSHLGDTTLDRRHSARAKAFALLRGRVLRMRLWEVKGVFVLIASGPCVNLTAHCSGCAFTGGQTRQACTSGIQKSTRSPLRPSWPGRVN